MNRKVSLSLLLVLLVCSAAAAQNQLSREANGKLSRHETYRGYAGIRLVQDEVETLPVEPPVLGLDDYERIEPPLVDPRARARARAKQPMTLGQILNDDKQADENCEWQFCQQVWQCAGGRDQSCWSRWRRDFRHGCQVFGIGDGFAIPVPCCLVGLGRGCGCRRRGCRGCGCATVGCGCGGGCGCGSGACTGLLADAGDDSTVGADGSANRGQLVDRDPYVNALEARDPDTEVVGQVQILEDKIIR